MPSLNGLLLVDKPRGMTSFDVIRRIRRASRDQKIGHAGTLDPDASGLLVLCFGKATKMAGGLTASDKIYEVEFTLGVRTDTFDSTGTVLEEKPCDVQRDALLAALQTFTGTLQQTVPIYSAVKIEGRRLYEYARKNIAVDLPTKEVQIHGIELMAFENPHGKIRVHCSKGTYVRSLAPWRGGDDDAYPPDSKRNVPGQRCHRFGRAFGRGKHRGSASTIPPGS